MSGPKKAEGTTKGVAKPTLEETQTAVSRANSDPMALAPDREATPGWHNAPGNTTNEIKTQSIHPDVSTGGELHYTHSRQCLTEAKLNAMSKPEIRAVALDRGYDMGGLGGKSGVIRSFLECQGNDEGLHNPGDTTDDKGQPIENLPATTEYPAIDSTRTDTDLRDQFVSEAKALGYDDEAAQSIASGRLAHLRSGGDGYTVMSAAPQADATASSAPSPASPARAATPTPTVVQ